MTTPCRTIAAFACLIQLLSLSARAADLSMPLRRGTTVTILRVDGSRESAKLVSLAADPPRLLLAEPNARRWGGGSWTRELPLSQVAAIESPGSARFHGRRLVVAMLVGTIAGGMLGFMLAPNQRSGGVVIEAPSGFGSPAPPSRLESAAAGIAGGVLLGTIVGLFAAPGPGPDRRWTFTERGAVVPDTTQVPIR